MLSGASDRDFYGPRGGSPSRKLRHESVTPRLLAFLIFACHTPRPGVQLVCFSTPGQMNASIRLTAVAVDRRAGKSINVTGVVRVTNSAIKSRE